MPIEIEIKLRPEAAFDEAEIKNEVVRNNAHLAQNIGFIKILKRSIDARKQPIVYVLKLKVYTTAEPIENNVQLFDIKHKTLQKKVAVRYTAKPWMPARPPPSSRCSPEATSKRWN